MTDQTTDPGAVVAEDVAWLVERERENRKRAANVPSSVVAVWRFYTETAARYARILAAVERDRQRCAWKVYSVDDPHLYETECGMEWMAISEVRVENDDSTRFCPKCGRRITVTREQPEADDE